MAQDNPVEDAVARMTPEQKAGLDVQRLWCTQAQVTVSPDFTMIVFRDQAAVEIADGEKIEVANVIKNVVTVVLPTLVARQLSDILKGQFAGMDAAIGTAVSNG